jgi:SlyX protein
MTENQNRITELEVIIAHQTQTIDELSAMVAEQWKVIDAMRGKLDTLSERFMAVEENALGRPEITKPPHW